VLDLTLAEAARALKQAGVETQPAFEAVRFGGLSISRLTLLGSGAFSGLNTLDLVQPRSDRYAAKAVGRAVAGPLLGRIVKVLAIEDFLLFKSLSTRDLDIEDAACALRRSRDLVDTGLINKELHLLAGEVPDFDVKSRYARVCELAARPRMG